MKAKDIKWRHDVMKSFQSEQNKTQRCLPLTHHQTVAFSYIEQFKQYTINPKSYQSKSNYYKSII